MEQAGLWASRTWSVVRSGLPGDHLDGGPRRAPHVLVLLVSPPLQQGERCAQDDAALRGLGQRRQGPQAVDDQSLPPLLLLLILLLRQQLEEDGDDAQLQTQVFTWKGAELQSD